MKKEKCLPLQILKRISAKYPDAWEIIETTRSERGRESSIWAEPTSTWPDWCYIPMGYCLSITKATERDKFQQVKDAAVMSALAPWRYSKEIYSFDKELANDLYEQPLDHLPVVIFERLPFPAIYIEAPDLGVDGFFVSREFDPVRKDTEIRLTFCDRDGQIWPAFVTYDLASTLDEAVEKMALSGIADLVKKSMQLVLYLCTSNPEVRPRQKQIKRSVSRPKDSYREIRTWDVGLRYGAAIKQYKQTDKTHAGSHTGKRPHYRKGHFQHYWRGPRDGERTLKLIWIDPILVNADKVDGELPAVVHEVKNDD